jgi:hypothetical protein
MDAAFQNRAGHLTSGRAVRVGWLVIALAALLAVAAVALAGGQPAAAPSTESGITAEQIVIRGEVADRYAQQDLTLSDVQIVIRGEVADRYAQQDLTLSDVQIVIRGEVAERYGK